MESELNLFLWLPKDTSSNESMTNFAPCLAAKPSVRPSHMHVTALSMITIGTRCQYHPTGSRSASMV